MAIISYDNAIHAMAERSAAAKYDSLMSGSLLPKGLDFTLVSFLLAATFNYSTYKVEIDLSMEEDELYRKLIYISADEG